MRCVARTVRVVLDHIPLAGDERGAPIVLRLGLHLELVILKLGGEAPKRLHHATMTGPILSFQLWFGPACGWCEISHHIERGHNTFPLYPSGRTKTHNCGIRGLQIFEVLQPIKLEARLDNAPVDEVALHVGQVGGEETAIAL